MTRELRRDCSGSYFFNCSKNMSQKIWAKTSLEHFQEILFWEWYETLNMLDSKDQHSNFWCFLSRKCQSIMHWLPIAYRQAHCMWSSRNCNIAWQGSTFNFLFHFYLSRRTRWRSSWCSTTSTTVATTRTDCGGAWAPSWRPSRKQQPCWREGWASE